MAKQRAKAKKRTTRKAAAVAVALVINLPKVGRNEVYKGIIVSDAGKPLHHVVELTGDHGSAPWDKAREDAKKAGYVLPGFREGALLRASDPRGRTGLFWLSEPYEGNDDYAYAQDFNDGDQSDYRKDNEFRVRLVRTIVI